MTKFSEQEKRDLLKFVTCHARPPLLGFKYLQPQFTIQQVNLKSADQLPEAATCFNMLKLPRYKSTKVMVERLKEAIQHNTGFYIA